MHIIEKNPAKNRVDIVFGTFEDHETSHFMEKLQQATLDVANGKGQFDLLGDFSQSMVMPQEVAEGSKGLAEWLLANGLRKSANILRNTTQRMQLARVTQRNDTFALFTTRDEAIDWLEKGSR